MDILVVLENNRGTLHRMSKEAVSAAQSLGESVSALAIGANADGLAEELSGIDLAEVITVNHSRIRITKNDRNWSHVPDPRLYASHQRKTQCSLHLRYCLH